MNILSFINTPFKEKFGIPRQPLLVKSAIGTMRFPKNDFFMEAFRGIEAYSHLWLLFQFHEVNEENIKALVRPPRFEGEKRGVFATRSPHRPNRIGMSVVKFEKLEVTHSEVILTVSGVDLLDGTPILDIKPYLPYADVVSEATAQEIERPEKVKVVWECERPEDYELIEECLSYDHRPTSKKEEGIEYGVLIGDYNIRYKVLKGTAYLLDISRILSFFILSTILST
ncbi:MAG: tRNA (N6-threonylcarbamoyladenosine(37)-N6)-methyltransferase TrmO [Bacteriovoracaceae bacterium]